MGSQGNSYLSKSININNNRSLSSNTTLGDRTITSNIIDGKRYFSSIDAEIYFGGLDNVFVDDIVQINWSIEQAVMPIFGYNSYTFDDIAIGARQVNGMFTINFTKSGFLYDVLASVEPMNRATFYQHIPEDTNIKWSSIFDKEHLPAWDRSFNIIIGYGDYKQGGTNTTMTLLYCVQLTGCQQVLAPDGSPIGEAYSFIAKDTRFEINDLPQVSDEGKGADENKDEFIFNINSGNIEIVNNIATLFVDYQNDNGDIKSIIITIRNYKHNILINKAIDVSDIIAKKSHEFDEEVSQILLKNIDNMKTVGIEEFYVYIDFKIGYSINKTDIYYDNLNNYKTTINKK